MSGNNRRSTAQTNATAAQQAATAQQAAVSRNNEYFIPRDGIDREVITADICRYLGNDALVRPGTYESAGQPIQGYYITAYRNLTTAMIQSLKEDSAKWETERRKGNSTGGSLKYADSEMREMRNAPGGGGSHHHPQGQYSQYPRDYDNQDHYSRTGPSGFPSYPPSHGGYSSGGGYAPHSQSQYSARMDTGYGTHPGQSAGYSSQYGPQYGHGQHPEGPYVASVNNAAYLPRQGAPQPYPDHAGMSSGYPAAPQSNAYAPQTPSYYGAHSGAPAAASIPAYETTAQPRDALYGRASPAGTTGYTQTAAGQQYDDPHSQSQSRSTATPASTAASTTTSTQTQKGTSSSNSGTATTSTSHVPRRDQTDTRHSGDRRDRYGSGGGRRQ